MLFLSLCDNPDVLKVIKIVKIIINLIKIIVPIALIVTIMISLMQSILDKDNDALNKELKKSTNKLIAAVLIFLIPTFVSLIFNTVGSDTDYKNCLKNANEEKINKLYVVKAEQLLQKANETTDRIDYLQASKAVLNVKDEKYRKELNEQLSLIYDNIQAKEKAESKMPQPYINGEYIWPISSQTSITSCFGPDYVHPKGHGAIDIGRVTTSTPVYAIAAGKVTYPRPSSNISFPNNYLSASAVSSGYCGRNGLGCGNYVTIDHGNGIISRYCHFSPNTITVKKGDYVNQGDLLGYVGSSGCSTGNHLHLQMQKNGSNIDPLQYVTMGDVVNKDKCK